MSLFFRFTSIVILLVLTTSCGTFFGSDGVFRSRAKDYLSTGPIKPIVVPEGMAATNLEELYVVREIDVRDEFGDQVDLNDFEVPRPRQFSTDKSGVAVKIQSQLGKRWIFLNASTSQVWPQTQAFLSEYNLGVVKSDANKGLIETDWIKFKDEATSLSRFRIKIEKGIHADTTEVHVLQVQVPVGEDLSKDFSWPEKSDNAQREKYLTDELAKLLAESVDNKAASLMGQNVGGADKVSYTNVNHEPELIIRQPFVRASASLTAALKSGDVVLWEQDTNRKLYYVGHLPAGKKGGFFNWFKFWRSDETLPDKAPHSLEQLLAHLANEPDVRKTFSDIEGADYGAAIDGAQGYLLLVTSSIEDGQEVQGLILRDHRGRKVPVGFGKSMLRNIRSNLI